MHNQDGGLMEFDDRNSTEEDRRLLEAFTCDDEATDPLQAKKAVLAVSFLLDWYSDGGSYLVEGNVANALGDILRRAARLIDHEQRCEQAEIAERKKANSDN